MVCLVALAHVNESWIEFGGSHPGALDRLNAIRQVVDTMTPGMRLDGSRDHPLGLLAQLRGFAQVVLQYWLSKNVEDEKPPSFTGLISALVELKDGLQVAAETRGA